MSGQLVSIDNLIICGEDRRILSSSSFVINQGETLAIFGPGGSGKSLLLKFLANKQSENLIYEFEAFSMRQGSVCFLDFNKKKGNTTLPQLSSDYFLIDEPENAYSLDDFKRFSTELNADQCLVFVTHNLEFLQHVAKKILVIHHGAFKGIYSNHDFFNSSDPYISYLSRMGC